MNWILDQLVEIDKLVTLLQEQRHRIDLLESQLLKVEYGLSEPKFQHIRLGFVSLLTQERFSVITLAAVFVSILGGVFWSLMGREGESRQVHLLQTQSHNRAPAVTVMPPLPAGHVGESGEKVRSSETVMGKPPVIAQTPIRIEETAKVVEKSKLAENPLDVNRPTRRKILRVSEPSFLRNKPEANADIIATLMPGSRVEVTQLGGDYSRVRALDADLYGFVHKDDAFFEPTR